MNTLQNNAPRAWSLELGLVVLLPALAVCASLVTAYVAYVKGFTESPTAISASHNARH